MTTPNYDTLVAEALAQLPALVPAWTDHHPGDPGITLIELAAFFVDMLLYQAEQVTEGGRLAFLRMLEGPARKLAAGEDLDAALDVAVLRLRTRWRAVTSDDYVEILRGQWPLTRPARDLGLADALTRIHCIPDQGRPDRVIVVVVPPTDVPDPALLPALRAFLDERRLLTVHVQVSGPTYVDVGVEADIYADDAADLPTLGQRLSADLAALFDPRTGGPDGAGWPFGRAVYASEVLARLDAVAGVDFVESTTSEEPVRLVCDPARQLVASGRPVGVRLAPHELVRFVPNLGKRTIRVRSGSSWRVYDP